VPRPWKRCSSLTDGRKTDAYATFKGMLEGGNSPKTFDALMNDAMGAAKRFEEALNGVPNP
tara:strand:+ start:105 stop:287 length:183 start_codon:yes stop_codon:yes gene_type:complete